MNLLHPPKGSTRFLDYLLRLACSGAIWLPIWGFQRTVMTGSGVALAVGSPASVTTAESASAATPAFADVEQCIPPVDF